MSRRVYLLGVGIMLVTVAFLVTDAALGPRRDAARWERASRVREGMTRAEVERSLGAPGDYRTRRPDAAILGGRLPVWSGKAVGQAVVRR